jgi:hypothetical protein
MLGDLGVVLPVLLLGALLEAVALICHGRIFGRALRTISSKFA